MDGSIGKEMVSCRVALITLAVFYFCGAAEGGRGHGGGSEQNILPAFKIQIPNTAEIYLEVDGSKVWVMFLRS